jgi:ribosomal protein L28
MARSCDLCGKTSIGGFNPQSVGMNRVRAHRRYKVNLQPLKMANNRGVYVTARACTRCRRTLRKTA